MRLFRDEALEEADVRPTLLGVVTLLFLLLFFLMSTTSGQRLGVVDLRLAAPGEAPPLPHSGLVKAVRVFVEADTAAVEFEVASTDAAASSQTRELRRIEVPALDGRIDYAGLARAVDEVHAVDGSQTEAEVRPGAEVRTETLLAALDVVRGGAASPRFPKVSLR